MRTWPRILRLVNLVVTLSLLLQLMSPVLRNPISLYAAPLPSRTGSAPRVAPLQPAATADLQTLLNLLLRQTMLANGWNVVSLTSQLSPTPETNTQEKSGAGQWLVELLDENQQPLTLKGALNYRLTAQAQGNLISNADLKLSGTLQAANVVLALDLESAEENDGAALHGTSHDLLKLTRNGKTTTTNLSSSGETKSLAYSVNQSVIHSTIGREGKTGESTQTITTRVLGRSESEVWLQVDAKGDASSATHFAQHFYQRVSGAQVMQYLDRFDWKTADNQYSLQAPAAITGTLDGEVNYAIALVDRNGKTINLSHGVAPHSLNLPAGRAPGLAMVLPGGADTRRESGQGEFAPVGDAAPGQIDGKAPPASPACDFINQAGQDLLKWGFLGGGGGAFVLELATVLEVGGFFVGLGLGVFVGLAVVAFIECNGDPYFVAPDSRPNVDSLNLAPLQITRVTGGLANPPSTVPPAPTSTSLGSTAPNFEYRDSAQVFVGGALPPGATAIGGWTWDSDRAFRGAPSHTQPRSGGPQLHYFIHAPQPLMVSADDNLIQYVYLDPQNPPTEIYLQFYIGDGDGEHRAYWGADSVQAGGKPGTASLYPMGALPDKGAWVRLRISPEKLGLVGKPINGILFGAYDGQTWWGATTTSSRLTDTAPDNLAMDETPMPPVPQPGAQIAFRLAQAMPLAIEIVDTNGAHIRTLAQNETRPPIYQVVVWDAKNDSGALVPDQPYRVRISSGGTTLAEAPVTISPFVANLASPGAFSVVRGIDVPIFGEAYGTRFKHYVVEYGAGLNPGAWKTLIDSSAPTLLPDGRTRSHIHSGNLANWNVGLDEFTPWQNAGLAGVYTLRLRVIGEDGREASDTAPLIVGRLASFPSGGTIVSADGQARLVVPPLATQNGFALLALVPLEQVSADGSWRQILPGDKRLAGQAYEIFPADERFRQDVTLELPYDAGSPGDKLGILIGDGTSNGWRYLGGTVDPQKQTIRVSLREFGGTRALVAPFISDNFGPPNPFTVPATPLVFDVQNAAPVITSSRAPFAFYSDLQANAGEWAALDLGTQLTQAQGPDAGLAEGGAALKITRLASGVRLVQVRATPYDAAKYPILQFDYRIPVGYAPDLFLRSNGTWWQLRMGSDLILNRDFYTLFAPKLLADDGWHHYQIDVLARLRAVLPNATSFQIDSLALGQVQAVAYRQYMPVDNGDVGSAYYIANFAALAPLNATNLNFTLAPSTSAKAYAFALDQNMDTTPTPNAASASNQISVNLPGGAADGPWYMHVRAQNANGQWSTSAHFPLLIDRAPPQIGEPYPPSNGAGSPDVIQLPVRDDGSGVDVSALQLLIDGRRYGIGSGIVYNSERNALQITPSLLTPALPFIANGQKVELALSGIGDYAGNQLSDPFAWSFTADRINVRGSDFRQLTVNGGEAPALAPDGGLVAFVSNRSGTQKIWVMRADDYEEKDGSPRQLTSASAHESDPAWSPDNKLIAFVSDANGAPQIWVAAPDGSGARAITAGEGTVASPTWSPDGKTLAFVRDGNLWQVYVDATGAHALTSYPERPFKAARWQPGGSLLAVDFKLYQETIDLYSLATGELHELTTGGLERDPEWLNASTLLYTAPAAGDQPDAVWQINLDGSGAAILTGSGQAGVSDLRAAEARDGGALALVSTRAGTRNIFLRANLQITRLDVSPSNGAPVGTPLQISYALPTDAQTTLEVVGAKKLLDKTQQAKGVQTTVWDGTDANGKPVAPGDYTIKLTAQVAGGGEPLDRYATARVLDASNIGALQVQVDQWANTPLEGTGDLKIQVYERGARVQPAAESDYDVNPSFKLPAGEYDLLVSRNEVTREFDGIRVEAGKTTTQALDLQLGRVQVTLVSAPGHPVSDAFYVAVTRSDDALHARIAEQFGSGPNFILPAGRYDLVAEYQGVRQTVTGLVVKTAQVTQQEISLGAGTLQLTVLGLGGKLADSGSRLIVSVFSPQDHQHAVAANFGNPLNFVLPAGRYDVRIDYGVGLAPPSGGTIVQWLNGVEIQAGQTTTQTFALHLGGVTVNFIEASAKAVDIKNFIFYLTPPGESQNHVVVGAFMDTATFQLSPGTFDVFADYTGTGLVRSAVATVEVKEGESLAQTIDLKLARVRVEVYDAPGQLSAGARVSAWAYPTGTRDSSFATVYGANPLELIVRAGLAYDLVTKLDGRTFELDNISLEEGTMRLIKLNASDFK